MIRKKLVAMRFVAAFFLTAIGAFATTPTASLAQAQLGPTNYLDAATAIATAIDRYEMASVWSSASPVMKSSIPEDSFVASVAPRRALLGTIKNRDWVSVMRVPIGEDNGALPAGNYVSVRFATTGNNGRVMEEVVSFRQDTDNQWRLVGYTIN